METFFFHFTDTLGSYSWFYYTQYSIISMYPFLQIEPLKSLLDRSVFYYSQYLNNYLGQLINLKHTRYLNNYFQTLLFLGIFVYDIVSIIASFLQIYYDIYFFDILSFSLYLLQISFYIYFLLAPLAFLYYFHSNLFFFFTLFLCFFGNKLYYPFLHNEKKKL